MSEAREIHVGGGVVAWDGRVLEAFGFSVPSWRVHVSTIESIEIKDSPFVGPTATVLIRSAGSASIVIGNDPGERAELEALLAEVDNVRGGV